MEKYLKDLNAFFMKKLGKQLVEIIFYNNEYIVVRRNEERNAIIWRKEFKSIMEAKKCAIEVMKDVEKVLMEEYSN